ncbi:translation initiation factor IF-2, putative [Trypanosoma brucei gambiense DAL972]|uniref:Eukaryotic translation initiation factor 5B n=1 Tax=Trypanosoma brucei gambiense (strain MHOM/CI/86/DAL972) TaxID=679716 RepID=C9ZJA9_TRYB9|nr:translation initiation factor IF-2, putative [Trypanosoma brucei gambiense DAL972]CBH09468.1 translation initiation factor IF-2, putative [Trypanosoma brucei gambiense DAL972]|eukprot:XP_011771773.1 translation initiation factor IF-2, putative [Trypanosoma brucei gambiense DAL972]
MPPKGPKAAPKGAPARKGGPPAAMIAKLKQHMEKQKEEEERLRREREEEEKRLREEERLAEEQRRFEEEERARERQRRKEEERLARKMGTKESRNDVLERMAAAGFIVPDVEKVREQQKKEREAPRPKQQKQKPTQKQEEGAADERAAKAGHESDEDSLDLPVEDDGEVTEPTESDAEVDEDDWEAMMERDDRREQRKINNERIRKRRAEMVEERLKAKEARKRAKEEERRAKEHVLESVTKLRSPICCVLGHVDTGKTSLLDRIRATNVQGGEAGGITQQIGATFFPRESIVEATTDLNQKYQHQLNVPGLLVIDTPGHESFTNLRSRGSSLCDIAILVVDIMHGLEPQTRESIRLLREKKCPFIVALNKVDRLYDWVAHKDMDIEQTLSLQKPNVRDEFSTRLVQVKQELLAEGLNSELYYHNKEVRKVVSIVPTSAKTGEGICDLILLEVQLVQQFMEGKVTYKDDLQCTILEVKPTTGYGFTIDAILINGELHEGDNICLCGQNGPVFTQIRALLTPQPMKELRVRGEYIHHKTMKAAMGIKIAANELEYVIPGSHLLVVRPGDDKEAVAKEVMKDANSITDQLSPDGVGVTVQSSTLGSLEALLSFLNKMKIPVASASIGPLHKRHMINVLSMKRKSPRHAVVLAFDVEISDDARDIAKKNDIDMFEAKIIYHLFDMFTRYINEYEKREKDKARAIAVFPVQLTILDDAIHNTDPIILPVKVKCGQLHPGTPLAFMRGDTPHLIGRVMSLERDKKSITVGRVGCECSVKINSGESGMTFGRQFDKSDELFSLISRPSVNAIKLFKDELTEDDINLLATLIKVLKVPPR